MNPILFLDLDGVLVHVQHFPSKKEGVIVVEDFDPKCVDRLNKVIETTGASVVIHSTWIWVDSKEKIFNKLEESGFKFMNKIHRDWAALDHRDKHTAIAMWLLKHPEVKEYVVLDDEKIGDHPQVKIFDGWFNKGLQDTHVEELIKALK
jgi:hypothetical protein